MNEHDKQEQKCFELNGILHLPHYTHEGVFVSPSDKVGKIEADLVKLGAVETSRYLWIRNYNEVSRGN